MSDRRASDVDRLDRMLQACDPIGGRVPDGAGMAAAFDSMSALIVSEPRRAPRLRRFATRHRAALAGIAAALLGSGVAVAATDLFVPTHTHQYPPQGMVTGGGPGELLNVDGTNFRRVALQISSDVPYPPGFESWRQSVISSEYENQQHACPPGSPRGCMPKVPSGQLHGAFAASAFCAWVLAWRHDKGTGRRAAAASDARVISGALGWKAVTDWDPHPSMSVLGDGGTTHPSEFGWMIPFIQAVGSGDVARVDKAIVNDAGYGGQFAWWVNTGMGLNLGLNLVGRSLLGYLDRHAS
jgi:hypothetical protein